MIIYKNSAKGFVDQVERNSIAEAIEEPYNLKFGRKVSPSEKRSWNNSMQFMGKVIRRSQIDDSASILIEYNLPSTSNRIDFIVAGEDDRSNKNFIIIELKQWEDASPTDKDDIVTTYLNGTERETPHPAYQATSYKLYLKDYNENVYKGNLGIYSCAYLHNYKQKNPEPLIAEKYAPLLSESEVYFKDDYEKLEHFIKTYVGKGHGEDIVYQIEKGNIRPSKKLIDYVGSIFKGNKEFTLLEEQKVAYETAIHLGKTIKKDRKEVLIIQGGPGTGKSVISVNLLNGFLKMRLNTLFVAPNSSFREVLLQKLTQQHSTLRVKHLFKGSSAFVNAKNNTFDVIVVDEAHRLKDHRAYMYQGENQVVDIIKASKISIFFIDDNQVIRPEDIGSVKEIKHVAKLFDANISELELTSQFRCSGSNGYLNWLDDVLQIKETANFDGWDQSGDSFDFKIFDNPHELHEAIIKKHNEGFSAQMLAGYAWDWTSARDGNANGEVPDVIIDDFDFRMPWNSRKAGSAWVTSDSSINEIGCIHTTQGLEFDYVGVIIGNEFRFDLEELKYYVDWNSYKDMNGKKGLRNEPEKLNRLVKNIYRTLMSRGMKGCYVFAVNKDLQQYLESRLKY